MFNAMCAIHKKATICLEKSYKINNLFFIYLVILYICQSI